MYELEGRVRYSETDERGRLSVAGLLNYFQDCCTMQAEDLGIGLSYLEQNCLGWFLAKYQIRIARELPRIGESITVATWPYRFRGFFGYRNFTLKDASGEVCVMADSLWILMHLESGKPVRLPEKMQQAYVMDPQLSGDWDLGKREPVQAERFDYEFTVEKLHLDTNHHMNNVHYVEAARGALPAGFPIGEIYVEYKKPAVVQDVVRCYYDAFPGRISVALRDRGGDVFATVEFKELL